MLLNEIRKATATLVRFCAHPQLQEIHEAIEEGGGFYILPEGH